MKSSLQSPRRLTLAVLGLLLPSAAVHASIIGFGDFSGFTVNQNDSGAAPTVPSAGTIELTNGEDEMRSIFANAPQNVSQFTASFTYQVTGSSTNFVNPGATFVLENDPRGASAVGTPFWHDGFQGIAKSVGITFDLNSNTTGLFTDGALGSGGTNVSPVNLLSGDPINILLTYSGSTLSESLFDTTTSASFQTTQLVLTSIPTTIGGSTAFVGLAAASPNVGDDQFFSNFQFVSAVPEPASLGILAIGGVGMLLRSRRRAG
jgi:hypothetical protein